MTREKIHENSLLFGEEIRNKSSNYNITEENLNYLINISEVSWEEGANWGTRKTLDEIKTWLSINYGHFDGSLEDLLVDIENYIKNGIKDNN